MSKDKRNRSKKPVPAKQTPDKQKNFTSVQQKLVSEQFHGPIPHPTILAGYEQLLPGATERIITMAEKETEHRQAMEKKALNAEIEGLSNEAKDTKRGQIFALIIGITAILSGTYTAVNGYPWAGSFIGAGGVVGLVSAFIVGRKHPKQNNNQKSEEIVPAKNE